MCRTGRGHLRLARHVPSGKADASTLRMGLRMGPQQASTHGDGICTRQALLGYFRSRHPGCQNGKTKGG